MSTSQVIRIRVRSGQLEQLGLCLQQLVEPGLKAPGCLEYQMCRDALESDLWLMCSQRQEAQQMFDYLTGDIQQVFVETLWRSLATSLEVQDDAGQSKPSSAQTISTCSRNQGLAGS